MWRANRPFRLDGPGQADCYASSPEPPYRVAKRAHNSQDKSRLTYRDAGVDIDAGNALVDAHQARSRPRPGAPACSAPIGGFGGLFDLKPCGFKDPLLVAATDGVGTKLKLAIETGLHEGIGIDLVAMNVNDLVVQGAEPLFFLDYFATGKLDLERGRDGDCRHRRRLPAGRLRADRRRNRGNAGPLRRQATTTSPALPSARSSATSFCRAAISRQAMSSSRSPPPASIRTASPWCAAWLSGPGLRWHDPAPFAPGKTLGEALLTPTRIYVRPLLEAIARDGGDQGSRSYHRRRPDREHPARAACLISPREIDLARVRAAAGVSLAAGEAALDEPRC